MVNLAPRQLPDAPIWYLLLSEFTGWTKRVFPVWPERGPSEKPSNDEVSCPHVPVETAGVHFAGAPIKLELQ